MSLYAARRGGGVAVGDDPCKESPEGVFIKECWEI